jgi:PKD repeat protein
MKVLVLSLFLLCSFAEAATSVVIASPSYGTTFPAEQTTVQLTGTLNPAHGGPGELYCNNVEAQFKGQKDWTIILPLIQRTTSILCKYIKNSQSASAQITIYKANSAPKASFTYNPSSPQSSSFIDFDASSSSDIDGTISNYSWDFGDGFFGSGKQPRHSYSSFGSYTVKLTVTDNEGSSSSFSQQIVVVVPPNINPQASFIFQLLSPYPDSDIIFDGRSSFDVDGSITSYTWNFGDGTLSSGPIANHSFSNPGTYSVQLTVTDNRMGFSSMTQTITIVVKPNIKPIAQFDSSAYILNLGQEFALNASSSSDPDGTITSYLWEFGDGQSMAGASTSHVYASKGEYNLLLTVTDNSGGTSTISKTLVVADSPLTVAVGNKTSASEFDFLYFEVNSLMTDSTYPALINGTPAILQKIDSKNLGLVLRDVVGDLGMKEIIVKIQDVYYVIKFNFIERVLVEDYQAELAKLDSNITDAINEISVPETNQSDLQAINQSWSNALSELNKLSQDDQRIAITILRDNYNFFFKHSKRFGPTRQNWFEDVSKVSKNYISDNIIAGFGIPIGGLLLGVSLTQSVWEGSPIPWLRCTSY